MYEEGILVTYLLVMHTKEYAVTSLFVFLTLNHNTYVVNSWD